MEARDPVLCGRRAAPARCRATRACLPHAAIAASRSSCASVALLCHHGQLVDEALEHRVVPQENLERVVARSLDDVDAPRQIEDVLGRTRGLDRRVDLTAHRLACTAVAASAGDAQSRRGHLRARGLDLDVERAISALSLSTWAWIPCWRSVATDSSASAREMSRRAWARSRDEPRSRVERHREGGGRARGDASRCRRLGGRRRRGGSQDRTTDRESDRLRAAVGRGP